MIIKPCVSLHLFLNNILQPLQLNLTTHIISNPFSHVYKNYIFKPCRLGETQHTYDLLSLKRNIV